MSLCESSVKHMQLNIWGTLNMHFLLHSRMSNLLISWQVSAVEMEVCRTFSDMNERKGRAVAIEVHLTLSDMTRKEM